MSAFDLIIFDCDGVLIESEWLAYQVESALLRERGVDISPEEVGRRYSGTSEPFMYNDVLETFGVVIDPDDFQKGFTQMFWPRAEQEMKAVEGTIDFIHTLSQPTCVCSNSSFSHIKRGLEIAGIHQISEQHYFAARDFGNGKPAPDVFLQRRASLTLTRPDALSSKTAPQE